MRDLTGSVYGRRMYEVMRYWDEDLPEWGAEERDFAAAWPHPMPSLLAVAKFQADIVKAEILGVYKPLQVKRIIPIIHADLGNL
jgi:hypothetical protein